ncbi:FMN-binding protein [Stratiformator vulcanicus]|uniref:FMN-binding protein n=1 Tax=Stratiformator vulcanicus TaxID=2527980 RepID=UPI002877AA9E|nr:FMN-binding protein [Stratiformator vulcanicus]
MKTKFRPGDLASKNRRGKLFTSAYMRRLALLICGGVLLCLAGCGQSDEAEESIVATPPAAELEMIRIDSGRGDETSPSENTALTQRDTPPVREKSGSINEPRIQTASVPNTPSSPRTSGRSLDEKLANLQVPPPWLASVSTNYNTSKPWKEARLEVRRLLGVETLRAKREAIKLSWIYFNKTPQEKGVAGEFPHYLQMGNENVWAIQAYEDYLSTKRNPTPIHSHMMVASLLHQQGEFDKAKAHLDFAMNNLPGKPWREMRQATLYDHFGDLYAAWGKYDEARQSYSASARIFPIAKPPYGRHELKKRSLKVQSKLELLATRALSNASLRDGTYRESAIGYSGDVHLTVKISGGRIADIAIKHKEKIEQNATKILPQRIIDKQSLQVDAVSGATVTCDAIRTGVYRALKKAGL